MTDLLNDEIRTLDTACPLDCPDGCSLTVTVKGGKLLSVDATPVERAANLLTAGFICQKVKHHAERVHGPDRITTPLLRVGPKGSGEFRTATWDEAMDVVESRLRVAIAAHGPASVLPYVYNSSAGVLNSSPIGDRVCAELGFAGLRHTICAATMGAAKQLVFGSMVSADPLDLVHSKYIVVWGANPTISNTHLPPVINTAIREGGAKLIVIDPRRTAMAERAHRHLAVRPGTDVVLAAAMARHLNRNGMLDAAFLEAHAEGVEQFLEGCDRWTLELAADITGIEAADIVATAEEWASTKPAILRIGWGMERNRNGGSSITTALALPVLMGHFGVAGSGILHSTGSGNSMDSSKLSAPQRETGITPSLSQNDLGRLLNGEVPNQAVSALIVQGANPALMNLDQQAVLRGLQREEIFTVVHEQVMTDTAKYADVVLPATTHFEADDLLNPYGSFVMQRIPAVIDRVGDSHTNAEFFADLGARFGVEGLDARPSAMTELIVVDRPFSENRATTIQMVDCGPKFAADSGDPTDAAPTDSRSAGFAKFRLYEPTYVPLLDEKFPLTLISPASNKMINSMFGERHLEAPRVHINSADASARGIVDGQTVRVHNDLASIELVASVGQTVRPGVVSISKGSWGRSYGRSDGLTVNALIAANSEPLADGACFNDARVQIG